jgi:hypothetical protein
MQNQDSSRTYPEAISLLAFWTATAARLDQAVSQGLATRQRIVSRRDFADPRISTYDDTTFRISLSDAYRSVIASAVHIISVPLLKYLIEQSEFDDSDIGPVRKRKIGLVAFHSPMQGQGPSKFCDLVDGTHQALAHLREGRRFLARLLVVPDASPWLSGSASRDTGSLCKREINVTASESSQ